MNREMRRLLEREERRQKQQKRDGKTRTPAAPTATGAARRARAPGERKPLWRRVVQFLHEVRVELKKVSWPTREQMVAFTVVTLITSLVLTGVVFGFDVVMKELVFLAIGGSGG